MGEWRNSRAEYIRRAKGFRMGFLGFAAIMGGVAAWYFHLANIATPGWLFWGAAWVLVGLGVLCLVMCAHVHFTVRRWQREESQGEP